MLNSTLAPNKPANGTIEKKLKHPIVIIHGFADRPTASGIERDVEDDLDTMGIEHFTPQFSAFGSVEARTKELVGLIQKRFPKKADGSMHTLHLMAHSMGGLNARDIATQLITDESKLGFKIMTITTLGTPHRGMKVLDKIPGLIDFHEFPSGLRDVLLAGLGGANSMRASVMETYNKTHLANPHIKYFSWAGDIGNRVTPLFLFTFGLTKAFGATDGLINVSSATWGVDLGGPGRHLGTLAGVDHASLVGRHVLMGTLPHLQAVEEGRDDVIVPVIPAVPDEESRWDGTISAIMGFYEVWLRPRLDKK